VLSAENVVAGRGFGPRRAPPTWTVYGRPDQYPAASRYMSNLLELPLHQEIDAAAIDWLVDLLRTVHRHAAAVRARCEPVAA